MRLSVSKMLDFVQVDPCCVLSHHSVGLFVIVKCTAFRLTRKRCEFQQTVNNLVGGGNSAALAAAADEGDGLGEELQEAAEAVRKALEKNRRKIK